MQGYFFSPPVPADTIEAYLDRGGRLPEARS
jgi:EAL domain-containing protein (putative c-di-GMP-specific phosphodiesterase class I)